MSFSLSLYLHHNNILKKIFDGHLLLHLFFIQLYIYYFNYTLDKFELSVMKCDKREPENSSYDKLKTKKDNDLSWFSIRGNLIRKQKQESLRRKYIYCRIILFLQPLGPTLPFFHSKWNACQSAPTVAYLRRLNF